MVNQKCFWACFLVWLLYWSKGQIFAQLWLFLNSWCLNIDNCLTKFDLTRAYLQLKRHSERGVLWNLRHELLVMIINMSAPIIAIGSFLPTVTGSDCCVICDWRRQWKQRDDWLVSCLVSVLNNGGALYRAFHDVYFRIYWWRLNQLHFL